MGSEQPFPLIQIIAVRRIFGTLKFLQTASLATLVLALAACNASGAAGHPGQEATPASPTSAAELKQGSSGISGHLIAAWGNAPAQTPPVKCIKVLDGSGTKLVTDGICTGTWRSFRVPLQPGHYVVEFGGHWERAASGASRFVPERRTVAVPPDQWVDLSPKALAAPVP